MYATPKICPACGELVIARTELSGALVIPSHPDRVMPFEQCELGAKPIEPQSRTSR